MKKIVIGSYAAVMTVGMLVAAPAAGAASASSPAGAGYAVTTSSHISGARVTLRVPTLTCAKSSATRSIRIGLFARTSKGRAVALSALATCGQGHATYRVEVGDTANGALHASAGDLVQLTLMGATGYGIDDITKGIGESGNEGSSGPEPVLTDKILVGAQVVGQPPSGVKTVLSYSRVNGTQLTKLRPRIRTVGGKLYVSAIAHNRFSISSVH